MATLLVSAAVSAQTVPPVKLVPFITSGLSAPVFMTNAGDGTNRLFIVQQGGIIRVLQPGSTPPTDFLNITSRVLSGGERGLLGLAFHPQYAQNGRFFVYYTRQGDAAIQISEFAVSTTDPNVANAASEKIIITIPHPTNANHNGGTVAFGPDGYLYAGPGDGGSANDPPNNAQNINQLLGKIIRIDVNNVPAGQVPQYNIPPSNPFAGATAGADEIFAVGMRNPYRFSFDRGGTGQLWAADVGQNSWEEVDIIVNGGNYGWRLYEGDHCTNIGGAGCAFPSNYVGPVFEYSSAGSRCSITGGFVYRALSQALPTGGYVYGDYCTGEILVWTNNQQVLLLDTTRRIVGFAEDEAGEIYVIGETGTIERLVRTEVAVSGRVTTPGGQGLRNATVVLTDSRGGRRIATTSSFGIYQFDGVSTGENYTLTVISKRYRFAPKQQAINYQLTDADFVGLE
jgi:glucose/arabinose dehydrogenase